MDPYPELDQLVTSTSFKDCLGVAQGSQPVYPVVIKRAACPIHPCSLRVVPRAMTKLVARAGIAEEVGCLVVLTPKSYIRDKTGSACCDLSSQSYNLHFLEGKRRGFREELEDFEEELAEV